MAHDREGESLELELLMQVFKSKIDPWLVAVILVVDLIVIAALIVAWRSGEPITAGIWLVMGSCLAVGLGLPLWLLLATSYTVGAGNLVIRCGPLSQTIPLASIERIAPSRSLLSAPALSLDRLRISYGQGGSVLVSPRHKDAFLRALATADVAAAGAALAAQVPPR
jgi:hypothetical protein